MRSLVEHMGSVSPYMMVVFFFQAEDGIRDKLVTGVQTCALPIWGGGPALTGGARRLQRLAGARRTLFGMAGPAKNRALAELCRAEADVARSLLECSIGTLDARIAELLAAARDRDLFGHRRGLDAAQRVLLRCQRASRRELRGALRQLHREGGAPFFAFEAYFGDILARGGVDVIVGNPPWVRGERLPAQ